VKKNNTPENLCKLLDKYEHQFGTQTKELFMLGNLHFYNFLNQSDSRTFNHAMGLPKKNGQEQLVYNTTHCRITSMSG
jgi:hypothetical protein